MEYQMEFKNICRACMSNYSEKLKSLFDKNYAELFIACTNIEIQENDGLPGTICGNCLDKIQLWLDFRTSCEKNDHKFRIQNATNLHLNKNDLLNNFNDKNEDVKQLINDEFYLNEDSIHKNILDDNLVVTDISEDLSDEGSVSAIRKELKEEYLDDDDIEFLDDHEKFQEKIFIKSNCELCKKVFKKHETYIAHNNKVHLGKKAYSCDICNVGLSSVGNLRRHKIVFHSKSINQKHKCDQCEKLFVNVSTLKKHKKIHANIRNYVCDTCGKDFIHNSALTYHLLTHKSDLPYACEICGKKFKAESILKVHLQRHNGIKPYKCNDCGKQFPTSGELTTHTRTHTGIRPFHCSSCSKSFKTVSQLYVHERSHASDRPFKCDICSASSKSLEALKRHLKSHQLVKYLNCQICSKKFKKSELLKKHLKTHSENKM